MHKNKSEKLPTLRDQDIVSSDISTGKRILHRGKLTTVGIALGIATLAVGCKGSDGKSAYDSTDVVVADTITDYAGIPTTIHTDNTGDASGPGTDSD